MERKYIVWVEGKERIINTDAEWERFRADHVFVAAAGGAVVDEAGRLLMIKRLGLWDLPKGKVDPGEGMEEAALREVREECGLEHLRILRQLPSTWHTYERKGRQHLKRTDWFLMQGSATERLVPQAEEDIEEVCWVTAAEVGRLRGSSYPSLAPVFDAWNAR